MHTFFAALFFILGRRNFIFHRFKRIKHCIHLAPDASTKEFDAVFKFRLCFYRRLWICQVPVRSRTMLYLPTYKYSLVPTGDLRISQLISEY